MDTRNLPLALGIICILAGVQTIFGLGQLGLIGIAAGIWLVVAFLWTRRKRPDA